MSLESGDEDEVVKKILIEPQAETALDPFLIRGECDAAIGLRHRGDAFQFAQDALAMVGDRARQQTAFVIEGDLVGALRRCQDGDHDADDRYDDDDRQWGRQGSAARDPNCVWERSCRSERAFPRSPVAPWTWILGPEK